MSSDVKQSRNLAATPIVIMIGLIILCLTAVLAALFVPAVRNALPTFQQTREAAKREEMGSRLKQIGLAMHNYASSPQPETASPEEGKSTVKESNEPQ